MIAVRDIDAALAEHASRTPDAVALVDPVRETSYARLADEIVRTADALARIGARRGARVALVAKKRVDTVVALFAAMRIGAVAVPINPLLKLEQVVHILVDSGACVLLIPTSAAEDYPPDRLAALCPALRYVVATEELTGTVPPVPGVSREPARSHVPDLSNESGERCVPNVSARLATVPAVILYTSGSTARPKGVVLSRSNLAYGAASVAEYLGNRPDDRVLALMPLSFDYGLNQVTTALLVGARAVLFDYLVPKGVVSAVTRHRITGVPAVPHLWNQLARLDWPSVEHLRYITNTGGHMPIETTRALARKLPDTDIVLMYGFTEAFRSTRLPPGEASARPDSIGKAVPHARVLVVNRQGHECAPGEQGELIHGGPLVALGYWNDENATAAKFRPRFAGETEIFAWSGDLARRDGDGYLYFVSRREDLVKLHGFRVNPAEIEEVIARSDQVREVSVVCVPHPTLGQAAVAAVVADECDLPTIDEHCRRNLPRFMRPERLLAVSALPTGPNSKIDRRALRELCGDLLAEPTRLAAGRR